jgi:succinate dehydrogenase/fumarate reductase flavoprotein subunit
MARARLNRRPDALELVADVLVIGGGPAGAWAALTARANGCDVLLVDKGFLGTSGATAPSNTETWVVPPGTARQAAIDRHVTKTRDLCNAGHVEEVLDRSWDALERLATRSYPFPADASGTPYLGNLRGPDYMRFMRKRVIGAGVQVLDHHPALGLLADQDGVGGAHGIDRQFGTPWSARVSAVVLASGGCAFGERFIGSTGLTGDGLLMAAEAGATMSGMEMSSQYAVTPAGSSLNKGMPFRFATFIDADGNEMDELGEDRQVAIAAAILKGPVFARLDKASTNEREMLRRGQPNCFLPYDRQSIDPFRDKFELTLRCEGTVRGVGGIRISGSRCETDIAGLYAAGDVASRQDLMGAISGGGGPNASWAIASGIMSGNAASDDAKRKRPTRDARSPSPLRSIAMRPSRQGSDQASGKSPSSSPTPAEIVAAVRTHMLPLETNFYRSADSLAATRASLADLWSGLPRDENGSERGSGRLPVTPETVKHREAVAMLACARWAISSAIVRRDSRGMHRRTDFPEFRKDAPTRIYSRGLDTIEVSGNGEEWSAAR